MRKKISLLSICFYFAICISCGGSALSPADNKKSDEKLSTKSAHQDSQPGSPEDVPQWCADPDPAIQLTLDAIRTSVGASSCDGISAAYLEQGNKTLMLYAPGVSNLKPLTAFPDLKLLGIQRSAVSDFSPLARLPVLETLIISAEGRAVNIDTLVPVRSVTSLTIENFANLNLTPLSSMIQLIALALKSGSVTNAEALTRMSQLKQLSLVSLGLTDLTFLPLDAALSSLDLGKNPGLTSIGPVAVFKLLTSLRVSETAVTDFKPTGGLASLNLLDISQVEGATSPADLEPLAGLTKLTALHANNRQIKNLGSLTKLPLRYLYVHRAGLDNFSDIGKILSLQYLDGSGNNFANTVNVSSLKQLRILNLSECGLSSFPSLIGLTGLNELFLSDNGITEIGPQPANLVLKKLSMARNNLAVIDGISGLTTLVEADFSGNKIDQIESLKDLPELRELNMKENPLPTDRKCPLLSLLYCLF